MSFDVSELDEICQSVVVLVLDYDDSKLKFVQKRISRIVGLFIIKEEESNWTPFSPYEYLIYFHFTEHFIARYSF